MRVNNVKVYDLNESILASGYPMRTDIKEREITKKDIERCIRLSKACDTGNGAHGQYLTGIRVAFDLTFSNKAWVEAERYRFLEFVSSQSTMHRITKFNLENQYNKYVDPRIIDIMIEKVNEYNDLLNKIENEKDINKVVTLKELANEKFLEIVYNNPAGFELTARMTTNYRCLKNIWIQRRHHKLPEWREFCDWIETLPLAKQLICYEEKDISFTDEDFEAAKEFLI